MESSIEQARINDIREWDFPARQALNTGPSVRIFCGDITVVELPRRMLAAVSTLSTVHDPAAISEFRLPGNMRPEFVDHIAAWLFKYCNMNIKTKNLEPPRNIWGDLNTLRAARLLGMQKYVLHIHRYYWYRLRNKPLTTEEAQYVVDLAESAKDPYLYLMAEQMADALRKGSVRDPERMKAFINASWLLREAVENAFAVLEKRDKEWEKYQRKEIEEEKKRKDKRKKKEENCAKREVGKEQHGGEHRGKQEQKHKTWGNRNKRDVELNRSLMEKMKKGKKTVLTREEARYFEKTRGKKCPYAVAH